MLGNINSRRLGAFFKWPDVAVTIQGEAKYWSPNTQQLAAFATRYGGPSNYSDSSSPHYWATEFGGVKIFGLSSYIDYEEGSEQYDWFVQALDR